MDYLKWINNKILKGFSVLISNKVNFVRYKSNEQMPFGNSSSF